VSAALGEDPGIGCRTWAALSLWFLGHPDRALTEARLAVSLAQDPSRSYSLANAEIQLAMVHQLRQEDEQVLEWAGQAVDLATRQGYPYRRAVAQVLRGWAMARRGACEPGIRELEDGIRGCAEVGAELDRPYHLALLAEAHLFAGRPDQAVTLLDEALALACAKPAFFYIAELHRLRGVAAERCGKNQTDVQPWIDRALEAASSQSALSLELRSALSLAAFAPGAHRPLLADTYARFTEGFETPDLQEARQVLAVA
jgi:adenylate cyclase